MMNKILAGITVCLIMAAGGLYCWLNNTSKADVRTVNINTATNVTMVAPNLNLTTLDGKKVTLTDAKGKPIFLNFWATWCPPCVAEMPSINELYAEYKDRVTFVMVSVDDANSKDKVVKFITDRKFTLPIYTAEQTEISKSYNIQGIPTTYIIGPRGNILQKHVGGMEKAELRSLLDIAINEK